MGPFAGEEPQYQVSTVNDVAMMGEYSSVGLFVADRLVMRCPSRYETFIVEQSATIENE